MPDTILAKYLKNHAEPEAGLTLPDQRYEHALVIPAHDENFDQLSAVWRNIPTTGNFLVILVINSPDAANQSGGITATKFTAGKTTEALADNIRLVTTSHPHMLIVDRYSPGRTIPPGQGVGLARKIGMDIATRFVQAGVVANDWLFTTDADVVLPARYFAVNPEPGDAALIYPFRHTTPPAAGAGRTLAMQLYEISLLYYAAGLRWATSPYAFPTIGSIISCGANPYAAVRGFPKRNTGEDFYLLNKLRKIGAVRTIQHDIIDISGRASERVPIGTGQAVTKIASMNSPPDDFRVEHPDCFVTLKTYLTWMSDLATHQPRECAHPDPMLNRYLASTGFKAHYEQKRQQHPTAAVMNKHLNDWFDGLKTRQFIHYFRDQHFGTVTIPDLSKAPFLDDEASLQDIAASLHAYIYHQPPL